MQFLHAVKMLLNPSSSGNSLEIPTPQDDLLPAPTVKKKNDLEILKTAYLFYKYARAEKRLSKLQEMKELKETLTGKDGKKEKMSIPFLKLRNGWIKV